MAAQDEAALEVHVEEEEAQEDFYPIERLQELGIPAADIKKAKEGGIHTCQALLMNCKKEITAIKGLSEAKADKMLETARKMLPSAGWQTGTEMAQGRALKVLKIKTHVDAVDEILGGGFETMCLTEIYGEFRTGKTLLCHTLCVTCQMAVAQGGAEGKIAYIDTEGTFRPELVKSIAAKWGLDEEGVLGNVAVARAYTNEHLSDLLVSLTAMMAEQACFKMLIVDSIMALYRADFTGRGELAERQQRLNGLLSRLRKVAEEFNVAVVYTNQVMSDPSGGAVFVADPKRPLGGHVLAHASTVRLMTRKGKGEQRLIKVICGPALAEAEASFAISGEGITAFKD